MTRVRRTAASLLALAVLGGTTACSSEVGSSGDQGFVSGKGIITAVDPADRKQPGEVAGETLDGEPVSLADYAGQVVVVNVWGSWCGPCRKEAPMLAEASRELEEDGVAFLGINTRDQSQAAAQAFVRRFEIPYPSLYDPDGRTLLSFRDSLAMSSIPSTVVVDAEGRAAGRVLGELSRATLDGLVEEAQARG
jgi:thiol-disulfide isomerase/thioredoxin